METMALHSMFEGLFTRALHVDAALQAKLEAKGYDHRRPLPRYPVDLWEECVDLVVLELMPGVPRDDAWVQVGRLFINGYFQTLVGKFIATSLPFLTPRTFLNRVPRFMSTGLEHLEAHVTWNGEHEATLAIGGPRFIASAFMEGILAASFERMKFTPRDFQRAVQHERHSSVTVTLR